MNSVAEKAEYVRSHQEDDGTHHCHWPGCEKTCSPAMWGCKKHWFMLPATLRQRIWAAYKPGQEISKTPSRKYLQVVQDVQDWINARNHQQTAPRKAGGFF